MPQGEFLAGVRHSIPPGGGAEVAKGKSGKSSERRIRSSQLAGLKHGKYAKSEASLAVPRQQLMMEKALLSQGISADQVNALAAHVMYNLNRTGELLEDELNFQTSGSYTKLALEVTKGLREMVVEKSVNIDTTSIALDFLREKGLDSLAAELASRFAKLNHGTNTSPVTMPELHGREESPPENGPVQDSRD